MEKAYSKVNDWDARIERKNTHSIKWDGVEPFVGKPNLLPLWVADMDFLSPQGVIEGLTERAAHGVYGYTMDSPEAANAFIQWVDRRHQLKVDPKWLVKSPGVVTAIGLAIQAFTEVGDGIVIQPPVYPPFAEMVEHNDRRLIRNPLKMKDQQAEMDLEGLEDLLINHKPKMMILCNPHNPLGRVWEKEVLEKVLSLCEAHQVILFSDEIHCDLVFKGSKFTSILALRDEPSPWMISAMAPSKTFNIAGLFYSLMLIPDRGRRRQLRKVMNRLHLTAVNCFNELAAERAYTDGEGWLEELLPYLEENYSVLCDFVAQKMPEVSVTKMQGTYLAWMDFSAWFNSGDALKTFMLEEAKVAVNDGRTFGQEGEGFIRFNFGCPRSQMLLGLEQIFEARNKGHK